MLSQGRHVRSKALTATGWLSDNRNAQLLLSAVPPVQCVSVTARIRIFQISSLPRQAGDS